MVSQNWFYRFRFLVLLVPTFAVMLATNSLNAALSGLGILEFAVGLATGVLALFCYVRLSRLAERRQTVAELRRQDARSGVLRGIAIGCAAFAATMLIIGMFGGWGGLSGGSFWGFLATFGMMAGVAVNEELVFRAVVFRMVEQRAGTWPALALSAVIFGAVHLVNPNATLWSGLAIAVEAGIMLGASYAATRTLWVPIGIHFAWNLAEAGVFGTAVSGSSDRIGSLLHTTLTGPTALTGGTFGPEASLTTILVGLVVTALMLRKASREGRFVPFRGRTADAH